MEFLTPQIFFSVFFVFFFWSSKEIIPVIPKGNQLWIFIGRTGDEAPILWPRDSKSWLTGKDSDAGKDWRQEKKGTTEDEMVGWHHQLNGHEFAQTLRDSEGQGSLVSCSPWGLKESDMSNWTTQRIYHVVIISAIQQSDSVIRIYIYIYSFLYSFPLQLILGYWL